MPLKIMTVGDTTDHGGKVITGSPVHDIGGRGRVRNSVCPGPSFS